MTTKNTKSLVESISNVLAEASKSTLQKFVSEFDDKLRLNVGNWMKDFDAIEKLMRTAKTDSYDFKEVMLGRGASTGNRNAAIAVQKAKGFKLFDSGTTETGETGLLFYKSVPFGSVKRLYTKNRFAKAIGKDFGDRLGKTTLGKAINSVVGVFKGDDK